MSTAASEFLDRTSLFASLDPQFKLPIAERLEERSFQKSEIIFNEGDPPDGLYFVAQGMVLVFVRDADLGLDFEVARLGVHEVFGETAILTGEPRTASVRALVPTTTFMLRANVFHNLLMNAPAISLALARLLAQRLNRANHDTGIPLVSMSRYQFDRSIYNLLPHHVLLQKKSIPVAIEDDMVTVAMVNAGDTAALDDMRRLLRGYNLKPVAITLDDYDRFLKDVITPGLGVKRTAMSANAAAMAAQNRGTAGWQILGPAKIEFFTAGQIEDDSKRDSSIGSEEVKRLLDQIVGEGIAREASDIHIEPHESGVDVRYRVEGMLQKRDGVVDRRFYSPLISKFKVLGGIDIAERRRPQDGRISLTCNGRKIDMRLSSLPVKHGEKLVMRILDGSHYLQPLSKFMLAKQIADLVRRMIFSPYGVLYVTGPTGAGKTTTLYSALNERHQNASHLNIVTVEDPIEYDLKGINQVAVNDAIGLGFAEILRATLRQDPDIILVGECRDPTSAKIAMEAALTGHLVMTSLHTNTALGAIDRLRQMGIPSYLIGNATLGVISQRLMRKICSACAAPQEFNPNILRNLADVGVYDPKSPIQIISGVGCDACSGTGFKGRVGAYEVLQVTPQLRHAISIDMPQHELKALAEKRGLISMSRYCRFLLQNGLTAPSEILRHLQSNEGENNED